MLNEFLVHRRTERSDRLNVAAFVEVDKVPVPFVCRTKLLVVLMSVPAGRIVTKPEGMDAHTGAGSIAIGPTASIAINNLRRDNLTGGAFFICDSVSSL
jgi:hypothetical protein